MIVQIAMYSPRGDKIEVAGSSQTLRSFGWTIHKGNTPAAYLTGYMVGKRARKKGIVKAMLDSGLRTPTKGGRIYACVKGLIDAGVDVPVSKEVLPSVERIEGKHIDTKTAQLFHTTKKNIDGASL